VTLSAPLIMDFVRRLLVVPALAVALLGSYAGAPAQPAVGIRTLAAQPLLPSVPHPWDGSDWLDRFYAPGGYAPAWTPGQAQAAVKLLEQAAAEGLDPADYGAGQLREGGASAEPAAVDVALTSAMLHYLADLRLGRVRSDYHTRGQDPRLGQFDPVELLRAALAASRLQDAVAGAEPKVPLYGWVKETLARYRAIAAEPQPRLAVPGQPVTVGGHYKSALALHDRLVLLGDLAADAPLPQPGVYGDVLADGVKLYQARHGLKETGELDAATAGALNVPLRERVRALELALERLRWLPDFPAGPLVVVDLPAYRLWAFDESGAAEPPLEMRVIVGDAAKTQTPIFIGQMRYLEFHPFWNVPRSIARKEIIPKLERNPGYLAHSDMELVGQGGVTRRVDESTLAALRAGTLRIRQRPGPKNSLGAIKFAMPNPEDIYLHATPLTELFERSRRDLSHGCIRVEQPAELAAFVLRGAPGWDLAEVEAAMAPGPARRVDLPAPVPVVLFYATALAGADGKAEFVRDIYRRDPLLERALRTHAAGAGAK
jgi:murein L,D-transpeptidase YcbB/YkuD